MTRVVGTLIFIFSATLFSKPAAGQTNYRETEQETEQVVDRALRTGLYDGHLTKLLRRQGDEGATAIARVLSARELSNMQLDFVLDLIHDCFSDLSFVENRSNREPRIALVLLRYLECSSHDPAMQRKIDETRKLLPQVPASSLR